MLLKSVDIKKDNLTTVNESCTLEEALSILEDSGYRCVPILDESGKIFRGNIYKMHIYRHKANGFTIKELPYIAVLDENNYFYGILTHSTLLNILAQSWNVKQGSYVLTIASVGQQGDLAAISKIIAKYSSIASCITLDVDSEEFVRRTLITLPAGTTAETCTAIVEHLERKNFKVVELENLEDE